MCLFLLSGMARVCTGRAPRGDQPQLLCSSPPLFSRFRGCHTMAVQPCIQLQMPRVVPPQYIAATIMSAIFGVRLLTCTGMQGLVLTPLFSHCIVQAGMQPIALLLISFPLGYACACCWRQGGRSTGRGSQEHQGRPTHPAPGCCCCGSKAGKP